MGSRHQQIADLLQDGINQLGLDVDKVQQETLIRYLMLLDKWNSAYNLSGIRDVGRMVAYHLLDSLAIVPHIDGNTILDVGTGAGLPGIPLAICLPEKLFLLLDSNGKKTRFLFQVKTELGLANVSIFNDRIENFQSPGQIDIVLCRAFAALDRFVVQSSHLLQGGTRLLAMKGQYPEEEIASLPDTVAVEKVTKLEVPGINGPRHLIEMMPTGGKLQE